MTEIVLENLLLDLQINVKKLERSFRFARWRAMIAMPLLSLAARIMGANVEIEVGVRAA